MIVISKKGIERRWAGESRVILELRGLSTDEKPTTKIKEIYVDNGSVFIEIDTGDVYLFDLENTLWYNAETGEAATPSEESEETPSEE